MLHCEFSEKKLFMYCVQLADMMASGSSPRILKAESDTSMQDPYGAMGTRYLLS
jgi:hypothetical protein